MKAFKFATYPNNEAVASSMTALVSAWFLVAACAILAEPAASPIPSAGVDRAAATATARLDDNLHRASLVVPDAYYKVTVQARRTAA